MKKNKNGITLIALVITIIVLLILAGISISLVTGQNGVLTRAKDANSTYNASSAKEQANMRAAGYVSEYMEKVYVDNDSTVGAMTTGEYVLSQINGKEDGDYRYSVSGSTITVTSKTTGEVLATGTIDDNGGIAWSNTVASGGNNSNTGVTLPEGLQAELQTNGTATVELALNREFVLLPNLSSDANAEVQNYQGAYGDVKKHLINGNWNSVSEGLYFNEYSFSSFGSFFNSETNQTDEYIDMTVTEWKILRINDNGTVDLVPAHKIGNGFDFFLNGAQGYNNGVKLLNDACSALYGDETKGITARSINMEDIEELMAEVETENGTTIVANAKSAANYGSTINIEITGRNCYAPTIYASEKNGSLGRSEQNSYFTNRENSKTEYTTGSNALTVKQTYYSLNPSSFAAALGKYASLLFINEDDNAIYDWDSASYWIASRCVEISPRTYDNNTYNSCNFNLFSVSRSKLMSGGIGDMGDSYILRNATDGYSYSGGNSILPIVTLNSGTIVDNGNGTYSFDLD